MHRTAILSQGHQALWRAAQEIECGVAGMESLSTGGENDMPHVQITWVEGRTVEQKRKIAERVAAVLIEDGKAKRENIHVSFHDVPATNYAEAGVLVVDQKRTP